MTHDSEAGRAPVHCGDEVKEFCELVQFLCLAPLHEHVMSEMVNMAPCRLQGLRKVFA